MERFLIKSSTSKHSRKVDEPSPKKTKKDYDKKYDSVKRKRVFQDSWLKEYPWLRVDEAGTGTCKISRQFPMLADQKNIPHAS